MRLEALKYCCFVRAQREGGQAAETPALSHSSCGEWGPASPEGRGLHLAFLAPVGSLTFPDDVAVVPSRKGEVGWCGEAQL